MVEEILCETLQKGIAEYLSTNKKFIPFYKMESGNIETVQEVYKKLRYSKALSDVMELTAEQYTQFIEGENR